MCADATIFFKSENCQHPHSISCALLLLLLPIYLGICEFSKQGEERAGEEVGAGLGEKGRDVSIPFSRALAVAAGARVPD